MDGWMNGMEWMKLRVKTMYTLKAVAIEESSHHARRRIRRSYG